MGEDQELQHVCKFCNKSFPSGRSLGGHMRSHLINSPFDQTKEKHTKNKLPFCPKKTSKFDTLLPNRNKICKECGKNFQSWKTLFGHMKCHSDKVSPVKQESWNTDANYAVFQKQVMESQSSSVETAATNNKKRSSRKIKRYMTAANSSTKSIANVSPCVSEFDQEQEEVAMSLIILSRDARHWVGLNPFTEFSSNKVGELVKLKKVKNGKAEQGEISKTNARASRIPRNVYKWDKSEVPANKQKKIKGDKVNRFEESDIEVPNKLVKGSRLANPKMDSNEKESCSKRTNFEMNEYDLSVDSSTKKLKGHASDSEEKIKFLSTTCNKNCHSYHAGGHISSRKKTKGCENAIVNLKHLQNQDAHSKFIKNSSNDSRTIDEFDEKVEASSMSKKIKEYECPICFKIFQSGQALGGHKRSHLMADPKRNNNKDTIIKGPSDSLDLNLPASVEEESSEQVGFQSW
ncbi:unnamed protein product [Withania somnifera]